MKKMDKKSAAKTGAEENIIAQTADEVSKGVEVTEEQAAESDNVEAEQEDGKKAKNISKQLKASFASRKFKGGAYATALSAIVIVVLLFVNLIIGRLDLKVDVTSRNQYTISQKSKDFMKGLDTDITIYYLVQPGNEIGEFTRLVEKYEGLSSHITVEYKDPIQYPKFAAQYTDQTITQNSIIVVNDETGRAKYVDYEDMLVIEFDYNYYQETLTGTDVEGQITSAIQYVTNEDLPVVYEVAGHGEIAVGAGLSSIFTKENIVLHTLETMTAETVPEDCDVLLINGPTQDLVEAEVQMIKDYLAAGGNAILYAGYGTADLPNYCSLLESYSIGVIEGLIVEGSAGYYMSYPSMIAPDINSHEITDSFRNQKYVIAAEASGLEVLKGGRTTIEFTELLTTSDKAYSKVGSPDSMETLTKEEGDIDGPFTVGLYAVENYNNVQTKIAVFASPTMIASGIAGNSSYGNGDLLINTINTMTEQKNSLYIPAIDLTVDTVVMTVAQINLWTAIYIVILPAIIIVAGIVVTVKRRKK